MAKTGDWQLETRSFTPHVTVATVVEKQRKFLLVRERIDGKLVLNQPAGHWEAGESLIDAAVRETLEETGWDVKPQAVLSISQYTSADNTTFLRTTFVARALNQRPDYQLDPEIDAVLWLSADEIRCSDALRSPLVWQAIERYRDGPRFALNLFAPPFN